MKEKDDILAWANELFGSMKIFRIEREPFQMLLDEKFAVWAGSNYTTGFSDVVAAINAWCKWHNIPKPRSSVFS